MKIGFGFEIFGDPNYIKIKNITFNVNKLYANGNNNLVCESYTITNNTTTCIIQDINASKINFRIKTRQEGAVSAFGSSSTDNDPLFVTSSIVIEYERAEPLPNPTIYIKKSKVSNGTADVEGSPEMYFDTDGNSDLDGSTIYYKIVDENETVTEFPVGEEAEAAGINSIHIGSKTTISQGGKLYYWAYNPTNGRRSEPTSVTLTRRWKIFAFNGNVDGTLTIYSENKPNGETYKQPTDKTIAKTDWYVNVRRIVFVPDAPNNTDAAIIDITDGTLNISGVWPTFTAGTKFTIKTQNGAIIKEEEFDCTTVTENFNRAQCQYILLDSDFSIDQKWNPNYTTKKRYIGPTASSHQFKVSQSSGFGDISIAWEPSANLKVPSIPQISLAPTSGGAYMNGIYRMTNDLDILVKSDGPTYYYVTADPTISQIPDYIFGSEYYAQYCVNDGQTIKITKDNFKDNLNIGQYHSTVRVLLQSGLYADQSHSMRSTTAQAFVQLIDARSFDKLGDIITEENTGNEFAVTNGCDLTITGKYRTRVDNGADLNTYYAYLRDSEGRNIKLVSQGQDFPESYKAGSKLSAGAFVGDFRYNYGSPEIVINSSNYSFLKPASMIADYEETLDEVTALTTADFNSKVRLRNVRWLAANNEVEDKDGEKYLIYSRLIACDDPAEFTSPIFNSAAGTHWCIEGYVGQVNGKTAIFPTAKVLPCPTKPVLLAPNPVEGDIEAISKTVTVTVAHEDGMSYFYSLNEEPTDMEALTAVPEEGIVLGDNEFIDRGVCELYVYARNDEGGLWSAEPTTLRITKHNAIEVATIADFKKVFIDESTKAEKKELFNEDDGTLRTDAINEAEGIASYYQLTGDAIVVKRTPNYLYLRDYMDGITAGSDEGKLGSMNYLLVYNANQWEQPKVKDESAEGGERELRAGDVITGIALKPELTSLGNLRSNSTTFARTVAVNYEIPFDSTLVQPLPVAVGYDDPDHDHYYSNVTVDDTNRMRYYTFEGVKVKRDQTTDPETYTLDIATPVRMSFDIFSTRGGWVPAYDENTRYTITGIVLRDGAEGQFAIAPISFKGSGSVAAPSVFLTEYENNDVLASSDIQEGGHTLKVKMSAEPGAVIYYSVNGKNPLDNADPESRKVYTAGEEITLEFAEGQDRAVVMAFAAEPGKTPSAVVTRTFIKSSRELTYLLNFINQGEQDRLYHFNGHVAVAALGGKWMMVRGAVGHYLPIYNADAEWDADAYKTGGYLTDFVMRYDKLEGNIRGIAEAGRIFPEGTVEKDAAWEPITFTPDSVTSISEHNARRYVKLHSANVKAVAATAAQDDSDADAAEWTVTGTSHQGAPHALVLDMLGTTAGAETLEDGGMYDITGFVMLDADGAAQLWATGVEKIAQTARVSVKINGTELTPVKDADTREYEAEFVRGALVTLEVSDPRPSTVIRYSYDNMNWFTYGEPFLVTESVEQIHAVAQALNERESVHTHIRLTRKDVTAAPVISAIEGAESSTVTISAEEGSIIHWWTSEDATVKTYTAPFAIRSTMLVYATAQVEGKTESSVAYKLVKVTGSETPEPADRISGRVKFDVDDSQPGKVIVYITPENEITGEYEIYYTTTPGVTLTPATGTLYNKETGVEITESKSFSAILVEKGKEQGELCDFNVWVSPSVTGIDGIEGDSESAVRADGDSIIAPEGSEVFDITGRRVNPTGLAGGVYIVRTPDGKVIKVRI